MSSDPDAPEIQEVFPDSEKSVGKTVPSHFTLVPVEGDATDSPVVETSGGSPDRIQTIEQSITRQGRLMLLSDFYTKVSKISDDPPREIFEL